MAVQPTGKVTLLFTDVEGSTRLLGAERYGEALELHRRLLREAFERHGGYEGDEEGDAFFVAFTSAPEAVAAAARAQRALASAEWPEEGAIRGTDGPPHRSACSSSSEVHRDRCTQGSADRVIAIDQTRTAQRVPLVGRGAPGPEWGGWGSKGPPNSRVRPSVRPERRGGRCGSRIMG
jgi:hypothetical protein